MYKQACNHSYTHAYIHVPCLIQEQNCTNWQFFYKEAERRNKKERERKKVKSSTACFTRPDFHNYYSISWMIQKKILTIDQFAFSVCDVFVNLYISQAKRRLFFNPRIEG